MVLLNPDEGSTVQGFLRVSVAVLRTSSGDEYVLHKPEDLDEQDEGDMSMVMGAPQIETKSVKLTINVYRVELAKYQLSMPEARRCPPLTALGLALTPLTPAPHRHTQDPRPLAGAKPLRTSKYPVSFNPSVNVELALPVYLPTLSDRVYLEILDNSGDVLLAVYHLSFAKIRNEGPSPGSTAMARGRSCRSSTFRS